ncbi:hypothetical protein E8E14_009734 [Neopestalotiopsis sp. 37M]|nr:hypothetical protein E8E14_009734 [Neopestalotiopsis sp. 37M]
MPSPPNIVAINGNSASGNAKVNNINIIKTINIHVGDQTAARIIGQFIEVDPDHQMSHLFPELGRYLAGEWHDRTAPPRENPHRHDGAKAAYCFVRNAPFPELDTFRRNLIAYLAHYPDPKKTRCVIEILNDSQDQVFSNWIESRERGSREIGSSEIGPRENNNLLLDLSPGGKQKLEWTTNFTLEVIGRINWMNWRNLADGAPAADPVVAHFCSNYASHANQWQEAAVRDLLAQLRRALGNKLVDNHNCKSVGGDDRVFHDVLQDIRDLWNLFRHTVAKAGIKMLYVILDNFDSLQGLVDDKILRKFQDNIDRFIRASKDRGVVVKLLVTSQSQRAVDYFPNFNRIYLTQDLRARFKR